MSDLIVLAAEGASSLPIPAEAYGVIAAALFGLLLIIVMSFSGAAQRREPKTTHGHQSAEANQAHETAGSEH